MPYEVGPSDMCGDYVGQIARSIDPSGRRGRVHGFTHCHGDAHGDDMTGAEMNSARSIWSSHGPDHAPPKSEFGGATPSLRDVFVIRSGGSFGNAARRVLRAQNCRTIAIPWTRIRMALEAREKLSRCHCRWFESGIQ